MTVDLYSTHIPTLVRILDVARPSTVVEFGMGFHSTPLFIEWCEHVVSVEMNSKEWYDVILALVGDAPKAHWQPFLDLSDDAVPSIAYPREIDLCLVDGHGASRPECANLMFGQCPTVVIHDTEEPSYGWERLKPPADYARWDSKMTPRTTVFTTDMEVLKCLGS